MVRWFIVRTLLYKEVLRYRYNWGVFVLAGALLALSALISIAARANKLPGQDDGGIRECHLLYRPGTRAEDWAKHLTANPPSDCVLRVQPYQGLFRARLPEQAMAIELIAPVGAGASADPTTGTWTARYWYAGDDLKGALPCRDWFSRESQKFLGSTPRLAEETRTDARKFEAAVQTPGALPEERVPLVITALVVFALYLVSFNLYIASTGEEREKRVLLGLLLSPASPVEMITAKALFYATGSLVLALAVVAMYQPSLLLRPLLWGAVLTGSLGYVAIGTVMLSIVRRQTTINTIPMLYLILTSIIMFLSQFLPLFIALRVFLLEDWLYRQLQQVIAGQTPRWLWLNQAVLTVIVAVWGAAAVRVFSRQGMQIARGR